MDAEAKIATIALVDPDGGNLEIRLGLADRNLVHVKNCTGRTLVIGQEVLVHCRRGAFGMTTEQNPIYITSILSGDVD